MRLSQKCQYALRACYELARAAGQGGTKSVVEIGERQDIPEPFLRAILRELRAGGFVESRRGKAGGYVLARTPEKIVLGDLIRYIDGAVAPVECASGGAGCSQGPDCVFLPIWQEVEAAIGGVIDRITLADLVVRGERGDGMPSGNYMI